ncbi:sensor histidine kinase [Algoriphagus sp. NG3]|uniref:sensor histidine kinase n=1 Tax=Algoriphagus sp. NG3 TaxID=3097546 RepID=UPI002A811C93|nr:histidine kinase [Algoriphagus sp. NG3]WPR77987.1 histidine kinase [Algoriphagus sp. NG3]
MVIFVYSLCQIQSDFLLAVIIGLLPVILAFAFIVFVVYRSRREAEFRKREAELRLKQSEGELKALRAQINPHFIFNCLNSIHHYIQQQDAKEAGMYLIKFSQMIRYVLESSAKNWVSLEDELETNRNYLQLEQLRSNQSFSFGFSCAVDIDPADIFIPPMLLQPFLENAVWHGAKSNATIELKVSVENDTYLRCLIINSGDGTREKLPQDLSNFIKKSSMGLTLMEERFQSLNELRGFQSGFEISDLNGGGKEVRIYMPYEKEL